MKKRVIIAGLFHETHTFLEGTTGMRAFQILRGEEMLAIKGDSSPLGGVLEVAATFDWEIIPTIDYRAQPSATVEDEVFEQFWKEFTTYAAASWSAVAEMPGPPGIGDTAFERTSEVHESKTPSAHASGVTATALQDATATVDAIYLVLHGAMVTTTLRDVEGEFLQRIRTIPELARVPIFGVFDLHANFTFFMAANANCLVGYRENPHTDAREAACIAAGLLERSFQTGIIPMIVGGSHAILWPPTGTATANDPMKTLNQMARRLEEEHELVWSVSVVAGFSFADTHSTGMFVAMVIDNTSGWATMRKDEHGISRFSDSMRLLQPMLKYVEQHRHLGNVTDPPLSEIIPQVKAAHEGLTVLVEPSDNIGAGAPGDGTGLLRALLENDIGHSAICIADHASVKAAEAAGVGSIVTLSIGGKGSQLDAGPVDLKVEVISLSDGRFELEDKQSHLASMCGDTFDMGRCAIVRRRVRQNAGSESPHSVECAYITLLLTSIKTPPFDLGQWRSQGIEPTQLSVIAVKAAVAHRRAYDPIAARMFWVDTPGPCSSNLKTLPYKHIRRPIYPLDS